LDEQESLEANLLRSDSPMRARRLVDASVDQTVSAGVDEPPLRGISVFRNVT
jgi:hypothetical protein